MTTCNLQAISTCMRGALLWGQKNALWWGCVDPVMPKATSDSLFLWATAWSHRIECISVLSFCLLRWIFPVCMHDSYARMMLWTPGLADTSTVGLCLLWMARGELLAMVPVQLSANSVGPSVGSW